MEGLRLPQIIQPDCAFVRVPAACEVGRPRSLESDLEALERRRREYVAALLDTLLDLRAIDVLIAGLRAELVTRAERQP
jgi:hypothetical protein